MLSDKKFKFFATLTTFCIITLALISGCGGGGDGDGNDESTPTPIIGTGSIQGTVRSSSGTPLNAIHVRAVNISDDNIQLSAFSGIGPNLTFQNGVFRIDGVPAGDYRVLIEKLDGRSSTFEDNRYSNFVGLNSPLISFPDEYFNGAAESSLDNPLDFAVITVTEDQTTQGINLITNDGG